MKSNLLSSFIPVFVVFLLCTSCGKDNDGGKPQATVTGQVRLFNEFGYEQTDRSGVRVTVADVPNVAATSAVDGTFSIASVPAGKHRFILGKPGYGTYQSAELAVSGSTTPLGPPVRLGQLPSWTIGGYTYGSYVDVVFAGSTSVPSTQAEPRGGRLYLRAGLALPTPSTYDYTVRLTDRHKFFWQDSIAYDKLVAAGLPVSKAIAYAIFPENPAADSYIDPVSGKEIYPAIKADDIGSNTGGFQYP